MKIIKKITFISVILFAVVFVLSGCETHRNMSYSYDVTTGDRVKLTLNTKDGYSMTSSVPVKITKNDETIAEARFYELSAYSSTLTGVRRLSGVKVIEEKSNDDIDYFFYCYNDREYSYVIKIKDSKTCIILVSTKSEEEVRDCFERLSFELDEK